MPLYGNAMENLESSFDQIKGGVEQIEEGYNHLIGLDWDEIFETLNPDEKRQVMELINQGLDKIGNGLYDIND